MSATKWLAERELGSRWLTQSVVWATQRVDRTWVRALVFPFCIYYALTLREARRAIMQFLGRVQGTADVRWRTVIHQFFCFATTLIDRLYILRGDWRGLNLQVYGREHLERQLKKGKGCILLGAHLGSFEVARASAKGNVPVDLRVLMHQANAQMAQEVTQALDPSSATVIIPAGSPDTMLRVKECLDRGGMVGILGDRVLDERHGCYCDFFARPALFPTSAVRLAALLHAPVVLFFGLYRGGNRYELHFETFAETITVRPSDRNGDIEHWVQQYVARLEHYCRMAPDNWFNFFTFWPESG